MQDYYMPTRPKEEYEPFLPTARAQTGVILFLRPGQIILSTGTKRTKSRNYVIRLAESIKRYGLLEPLQVRLLHGVNGEILYELCEGSELPFQAACLAGMDKLPCVIPQESEKTRGSEEIFAQIRQKKLHMFDQAAAFRVLLQEYNLTQGEIAERLDISQSAVANKLRLLGLSAEERREILQGNLSERHARAILRLKTHEDRTKTIRTIRENRLTVAATEELIEEMLNKHLTQTAHAREFPVNTAAQTPSLFEESTPTYETVQPRKFVLKSLQPLYNSIDRTLSIFKKTGCEAQVSREESPDGVCITIKIPARGQ